MEYEVRGLHYTRLKCVIGASGDFSVASLLRGFQGAGVRKHKSWTKFKTILILKFAALTFHIVLECSKANYIYTYLLHLENKRHLCSMHVQMCIALGLCNHRPSLVKPTWLSTYSVCITSYVSLNGLLILMTILLFFPVEAFICLTLGQNFSILMKLEVLMETFLFSTINRNVRFL